MSIMEEQKGAGHVIKPQRIILLVLALVIVGAVAVVIFLQYDPVVAVVNGEKIKRSELYSALYLQSGRDTLDSLITERLILQEGKKCGISVSDEEIDAEIDSVVGEYFMGDEEQFNSYLEQQGYSVDLFRDDLRVNLMAKKIVTADLEISEEEAREYFKENQEKFDIPEQVKARHILVETEEEARKMISRLEKGEDFAELAKKYSQDPGSKEQGGDLGFFSRGEMAKEFEEAAFALKDGERSAPVKTYHGYHVIETLEHKEGRAVTYEEVEDKVKEAIRDEQIPLLLQELITRLRTEALIDYRDLAAGKD